MQWHQPSRRNPAEPLACLLLRAAWRCCVREHRGSLLNGRSSRCWCRRYNPRRSPSENINLPQALLSRFDILFLLMLVTCALLLACRTLAPCSPSTAAAVLALSADAWARRSTLTCSDMAQGQGQRRLRLQPSQACLPRPPI